MRNRVLSTWATVALIFVVAAGIVLASDRRTGLVTSAGSPLLATATPAAQSSTPSAVPHAASATPVPNLLINNGEHIAPAADFRITGAGACPSVPTATRPPQATSVPSSYLVHEGDTLLAIANSHHVTVTSIVLLNELESGGVLMPGSTLLIPQPTPTPFLPRFESPLVILGSDETFPGIDLYSQSGADVHASANGEVIFAGQAKDGYGLTVMLSHPDGFVTLYARLGAIMVTCGRVIAAGETLGQVAETSTGQSYLHFEIRQPNGQPASPWNFMPPP